jgi:hypothetical protein
MTTIFSFEQQLDELAALVESIHVHKAPHVKGPYTTSDYVTWRLNAIFTPAGWSFRILEGPSIETISDGTAYVRCTGRISVMFANGSLAERDEIGCWPMTAKGGAGEDLHATPPENYETVLKASVSDALKACAERLGPTFRPLTDLELDGHLRGERALNNHKAGDAKQAIRDLFDAEPATSAAPTPQGQMPLPAEAQPTAQGQRLAKDSFYQQTSILLKDKRITAAEINRLAQQAKTDGWIAVLKLLPAAQP